MKKPEVKEIQTERKPTESDEKAESVKPKAKEIQTERKPIQT